MQIFNWKKEKKRKSLESYKKKKRKKKLEYLKNNPDALTQMRLNSEHMSKLDRSKNYKRF